MSSNDSQSDEMTSADVSVPSSGILPDFIGGSFLAKFVVSLLIISLFIGGVSAFTYLETSNQLSQEAQTEYTGLAEQSVTQIVDWRSARSDTTRMLSQFEVIQSGNPDRIQDFLQQESTRLPPDVYRVHYVDLDNATILASTNLAKVDETLNTREAPWQTKESLDYGPDEVFISNASEVHLRSVVSFVSPVDTDAGDNMVLVMQTDFDTVARGLPTPDTRGQNVTVFSQVVDSQGRIVAGTQETSDLDRNDGSLEDYLPGRSTDTPVIQNAIEAENPTAGFLQSSTKNLSEDHIVAYAPVPGDDWAVAVHVPQSFAFSLRSTITNSLLLLVATTLVGLGAIAVTFGRGTTSALRRLTQKANALESGNLDVDLEPNRADEFGSLTASFANMRNALRERIKEAETARKEAEVSRAEAVELTNYLQEKADEYAQIMQKCAAGDITQRMETDGESEAMDRIAEEFNEMIGELEKTTGQLKSFSEEVDRAGNDVRTSAEAIRETSEEVAASAQTVSDETHTQQERLQEISENMDAVADKIEALAADQDNPELDESLEQLRSVATLISEVSEVTDEVMTEAENVAGAAEEQAAELTQISERAGDLSRYAGPLQEVLDRFKTESEHQFYFPTGPGSEQSNVSGED